jgi:hypothetical protein
MRPTMRAQSYGATFVSASKSGEVGETTTQLRCKFDVACNVVHLGLCYCSKQHS